MQSGGAVEPETQHVEQDAEVPVEMTADKENTGPEVALPTKGEGKGGGSEIEEAAADTAAQDPTAETPKTPSRRLSVSRFASSFSRSRKGKDESNPLVPVGDVTPKKGSGVSKLFKNMLSKKKTEGEEKVQESEETQQGDKPEEASTKESVVQEKEPSHIEQEETGGGVLTQGRESASSEATPSGEVAGPEEVKVEGVAEEEPETGPENGGRQVEGEELEEQKAQAGASEKPAEIIPPLHVEEDLHRSSISDDAGLFSGFSAAAIAAELKPHMSPRRQPSQNKKMVGVVVQATSKDKVKVVVSPVREGVVDSHKPNFIQRLFSKGGAGSMIKEDEKPMINPERDVGYSLTAKDVHNLRSRLDDALQEQGIDSQTNFDKDLEEFDSVVDYFIAMEASLGSEDTAPGIRESLAGELGEEHPLVIEMQRKQTIQEINEIDEYVKASIDKDENMSEQIFTEDPEKFKSSAEYYRSMQANAMGVGVNLLPALTQKLGKDHPLVQELAEAEVPQEPDVTVEIVSDASKVELPVSQGGILAEDGVDTKQNKGMIVRDETQEPQGMCGCRCLASK